MEERGASDALGGEHSEPFVDKPTGQPTAHWLDRSTDSENASALGQDGHALGRAAGGDFGRKRDSTADVGAAGSILLAVAALDKGRVAE